MLIVKEFTFDSAHFLPWHEGKCKNLHGHTYKMQVGVRGQLNPNGIVIDFGDLKNIVNSMVIEKLDHKYLNDIYSNPTAEVMALEIFGNIRPLLKKIGVDLAFVRLWETPTSFAEATYEDFNYEN